MLLVNQSMKQIINKKSFKVEFMKLTRKIYLLSLLLTALQLTACATAPWDEPKKTNLTPEEKVKIATEKFNRNSDSTKTRKELLIAKEESVNALIKESKVAHANQQYDKADELYSRVLNISPENVTASNGRADIARVSSQQKQLDLAKKMIEENKLEAAKEIARDVLLQEPKNAKAKELLEVINKKTGVSKASPAKLKPNSDKQVTLELRDAEVKVVFEALSRATGINFILDKDIKPNTKATIFVKKMRIEDAIEIVLSSNGLQKKVLSENTALIYPNTPAKLKDYQDLVIRNFYLTNTNAKQVALLVKTMLKTKDVFIDERLNMFVMRDRPEVIRLAEKLVAANDLADPEVMLEIEVLEVSRTRLQELGIVYPNQVSVLTPATLTVEALKALKSANYAVSPNPALNFKKTTGDVNLLSNPRIRVKNNEKAKVLVGDKVPIITTTSTANVGISESVQYVDVGLKVDVEPRILLDDFVNIKVGLEVSSLGEKTVTRNGTTVYTIGTRNANTLLRLKDGETQVLAGLILDDERKNASKLPALGDIPILGRLFSSQEDKKSKTEIVLAITPKVLGNIRQPEGDEMEYWSGTESVISDTPRVTLPAQNAPQDRTRPSNPEPVSLPGGGVVMENLVAPNPQENLLPGESIVPTEPASVEQLVPLDASQTEMPNQ